MIKYLILLLLLIGCSPKSDQHATIGIVERDAGNLCPYGGVISTLDQWPSRPKHRDI